MNFQILTKDEFNLFLNSSSLNNFLQSPLMDDISISKGQNVFYVGIKEKKKILCAARLLCINSRFGKKIFYSPRGLLIDYKNKDLLKVFIEELKKFIKSKNGFELIIDPNILYKERDIDGNLVPNGFDNTEIFNNLKNLGFKHQGFKRGVDTSRQVRWTFSIDLRNKNEEEIFSNFNQNTKRLINKAIKNKIEIEEISYDQLSRFKLITENSSKRVGFKDKSLDYYQKMYKQFVPENKAKFLVAFLNLKKYVEDLELLKGELNKKISTFKDSEKIIKAKKEIDSIEEKISYAKEIMDNDGEIIDLSAAMFITYGKEVIYAFGGNIDKYMSFNASHLIQWEMIKYAIKNKYEKYDFYGISGIFDKTDSNYGVYNFKRGFCGVVEEYIGEFILPITSYYYFNNLIKKIKK